jgi:hypothetical protein
MVRPIPGYHGRRGLCPAVLEAAGLPTTFRKGRQAGSIREQTVSRLQHLPRGRRVREVYVLRAHTVQGSGWSYLAELAAEIGARLSLVVHAPQPCLEQMSVLRWGRVRVAVPRVLHLTTDRRALEVGIPPVESWTLDPSIPCLWLPEVSVPMPFPGRPLRLSGPASAWQRSVSSCPIPLTLSARSY